MSLSSIRPVTLNDVVGLDRYEAMRDEVRRRVIALKRHRRVPVGESVTFVFENYDTVFFQIHEMLRAERITDLDAVRYELEVYNALLPQPGELSATMLIEMTDQDTAPERLRRLIGIDESVRLHVGPHAVPASFEVGRSNEEKLSAVQYVRFALPAPARQAFADPATAVALVIDHPHYQARTALEGEVRAALADDLRGVP